MSPSSLAGLPGPLAIEVKLEGLNIGFAFLGLRGDQLESWEVVSESFEVCGQRSRFLDEWRTVSELRERRG